MIRYNIEEGKCFVDGEEVCPCKVEERLDYLAPTYHLNGRAVDTKILLGMKREAWRRNYEEGKTFFDGRFHVVSTTIRGLERDLESKKQEIVRVMKNDEVKELKSIRVRTLAEQQVAIENNLRGLKQTDVHEMQEYHLRPYVLIALILAIQVSRVDQDELKKKSVNRPIELVKIIEIGEGIRVDGEEFDLENSSFVHFARWVFGPVFSTKISSLEVETGLSRFKCPGVIGYK